MKTMWTDLDVTGERMPAYVAVPDGDARAGVIVIQEIFGVNGNMRAVGDLLAGAGYLAVVPAFFHRTDPDFAADYDEAGFAKGRAAARAVDRQQLVADLAAAAGYLRERLGADAKVATWGFCFGGTLAYVSATLPFVDAASSFYGGQIASAAGPTHPAALAVTEHLTAPLFLAFGGRDEHIPESEVAAIHAALDEHGKVYDLRVYPEADHGFFRYGPESNEAAADAWTRVRAFLSETVG